MTSQLTAEEHYDRAMFLLHGHEHGELSSSAARLSVSAAHVHAQLASFRLAADNQCSLEHVARIAECLVTNPPGTELNTLGQELLTIVGEPPITTDILSTVGEP